VAKKSFDLIAFGKLFLANPDLVLRIFAKVPLLPYTAETMQSLR
jgi:2,4-dienoyl-CoA reductase-like NADH-dependent reductase (Old Yellow Enzyme family)